MVGDSEATVSNGLFLMKRRKPASRVLVRDAKSGLQDYEN